MKQLFLFICAFAFSVLMFSACKKDESKTVQERIQGMWTYQKEIYHSYNSTFDYRDTTYGAASDYADFRSDNKVYIKFDGSYDTLSYTLLNDSQIYFSWGTGTGTSHANANITVLNDNEFYYYYKDSSATVHGDSYTYLTR